MVNLKHTFKEDAKNWMTKKPPKHRPSLWVHYIEIDVWCVRCQGAPHIYLYGTLQFFLPKTNNSNITNLTTTYDLQGTVLGHCTILLEHLIIMRTTCFDTDFTSQMKLTKLTLIYYFYFLYLNLSHL